MKQRKIKDDVIYPVRIPRDVFKRAKEMAERMDLSACQFIRAALREKIAGATGDLAKIEMQ